MARESDFCEICEEEYAEYYVDGTAMCLECAEETLNSFFNELTTKEKAAVLGIVCSRF